MCCCDLRLSSMPRFIPIITLYIFLSLVGISAFITSTVGHSKKLSFCNEIDNNIRCVHLEASTSTNIEITGSSSTPTATSFISPTYKVYIEDTDSYGVMYNGNYLRSYERALSNLFRSSDGSYDRHRWIITHVTKQKFRSSPALGEKFLIRGHLVDDGDDDNDTAKECVQTWRLEMVTKNNKTENDDDWIVHNPAQVTLARPTSSVGVSYLSPSTTSSKKRVEETHRAYYDELDSHYYPQADEYEYHVPLRSAMNYFERSRSNMLGGPDILAKMQNEEDILWVVTGLDDGEFMLDSIVLHEDDLNINQEEIRSLDWQLTPGKDVIVDTDIFVKRRGMFVECHHRLLLDVKLTNGDNKRRLLAKATITIMAITGSTHRPTSKLPKWVLELLGE